MTGNDVEYTYGTSGNETGRPVRIVDGSGMYECTYDKLGNVTDETRTIALPQHSEVYQFRMLYQYDSWGRMLTMTYPDGETVTYTYCFGGDLLSMYGDKGAAHHDYVLGITYNDFGQRSHIAYANGASADYTYDALHRLSQLTSISPSGGMQRLDYATDGVGNITQASNSAAAIGPLGGAYTNLYHYDALNRLTHSNEAAMHYNILMDYSPSGRLVHKQAASNMTFPLNIDAFFGYCNDKLPHAPKRIYDIGSRTLTELLWDGAGNLAQVNTATEQCYDGSRFLFWTEDSRLHTVADDGWHSYYAYDHAGERTLKLTGKSFGLDINSDLMYISSTLDAPTLYPSPYMVVTDKGYTKHYYVGADRLCARIGGGSLPAASQNSVLSNKANNLYNDCVNQITGRLLDADSPECIRGLVWDDDILRQKIKGAPSKLKVNPVVKLTAFVQSMTYYATHNNPEHDVYFYHGDHLGSASWITDKNGIPVQHLQYLPFGEPYVSQHAAGGYEERFTFTGKERDEETGYGYFGARYMDHELMTMWLSVDPMADKYPNISPYAYCIWNPIVLIDPDGNEGIVVSGGEYDGDRYKYNFIEPAITKLKALKAAAGNEPITWVVMTAGYSESDMASFQKIARDLGVGFQAISSADEFTNYLNAKSIGSAELSEARRNDPITSISVFGHGYAGSAEFAHNQPGQGRFSWGTGNVKQLDAGAFKNATVDFYTCNSATDPEKGKSLGYVFSQQTGAVVTGYRGKSTYAKMNVGEGIGAKWDRLWEGFNPNGSVRLPQAGEGAIRIKFLPPVMNGNQ